jgi:hypothetical protein
MFESRDTRQVLLFMRLVRIALHENDDPKQVAVNFARIYSLNSGMLATLEEMLAGYLK